MKFVICNSDNFLTRWDRLTFVMYSPAWISCEITRKLRMNCTFVCVCVCVFVCVYVHQINKKSRKWVFTFSQKCNGGFRSSAIRPFVIRYIVTNISIQHVVCTLNGPWKLWIEETCSFEKSRTTQHTFRNSRPLKERVGTKSISIFPVLSSCSEFGLKPSELL